MDQAFRIVPLAAGLADQARRARVDAFGHALAERRDAERHQCRSCLRLTEPFEAYLALLHRPFERPQAFAESGPVYLHARACEPYAQAGEWPAEFPREQVVLRAYGADDEIADARFVGRRPVEQVVAELLAEPRTAYLHARNSTYGCYMFRVERA